MECILALPDCGYAEGVDVFVDLDLFHMKLSV